MKQKHYRKNETYDDFLGPLRRPTHWGDTPLVSVVELNGNMTMKAPERVSLVRVCRP